MVKVSALMESVSESLHEFLHTCRRYSRGSDAS